MINSRILRSSWQRYLLLLVCMSIFLPNIRKCSAQQTKQKTSETIQTWSSETAGPYCGLFCIYMMMKSNGQDIVFEDLVKPEYVGSTRGSTFLELKKAAEDNKLHAAIAGRLTSRLISFSPYKVILHVKSSTKSKTYDHYFLFLGTQNGKAKIFDPPGSVKLITFAELAQLWDGNGLIISTKPIDLNAVFAPARNRLLVCIVIVIGVVLAIRWSKKFIPATLFDTRIKKIRLSLGQTAGFVLAAAFIGMFYHFTNETGFLAGANTVVSMEEAHQGNFIPKLTEKKVEQLLNTDTIFIDARLSRDYEAGHLEGAISVPVNSTDEERHKKTADISKETHIVLYCQSSGCQYAEKVAVQLITDGFTNISIYKGGWADWTAKNNAEKEKTS